MIIQTLKNKDELEELANQYLDVSKSMDKKDELYKNEQSQMNTITTINNSDYSDETL